MTKRQSGSQNEQSHTQPGEDGRPREQSQQGGKTVGESGVGLGGLGNQVNQGQGQQKPGAANSEQGLQTPGTADKQQSQQQAGAAQRGSMNKPGDANESGSAGSTRRDDGASVKGR